MLTSKQKIGLIVGVILVVIILVIVGYMLLSSSNESFDGTTQEMYDECVASCPSNCKQSAERYAASQKWKKPIMRNKIMNKLAGLSLRGVL